MTQIKPTAGQMTPRFADIATFFRLPIIKDLSKLDYLFPLDNNKSRIDFVRIATYYLRNII